MAKSISASSFLKIPLNDLPAELEQLSRVDRRLLVLTLVEWLSDRGTTLSSHEQAVITKLACSLDMVTLSVVWFVGTIGMEQRHEYMHTLYAAIHPIMMMKRQNCDPSQEDDHRRMVTAASTMMNDIIAELMARRLSPECPITV